MLTLPIKKKWFDMIKSGEKKEEYREIKPYYDSRFLIYYDRDLFTGKLMQMSAPDEIILRNGYSSNSPTIKCKVKIEKGYGKPEWGAEPNKKYFILKILSVEEVN